MSTSRFGVPVGRAGVTLLEVVLVLALGSLVATIGTRTFRVQRRAIAGAVELAEMRAQLRQGAHILASELRAISPAQGDIIDWAPSSVTIRSMIGTSVVCRRQSDFSLVLPPLDAEDQSSPTSWMIHPQPGDSLRIRDDLRDFGSSDDAWRLYEIAEITSLDSSEPCALGRPALLLRVRSGTPLPETISLGAPIRIFHPARYELYRSSDGRWYLGASECRAGRSPPCSTIQPVSGPYRSRDAATGSGLELAYFDRAGAMLRPGVDDPRRLARIDVTLRADSRTPLVWRDSRSHPIGDSMQVSIAPRNQLSPE